MQGILLGTLGGRWVIDQRGIIIMTRVIYDEPKRLNRVENVQDAKVGGSYFFDSSLTGNIKINKQDIPLLFELTHGKVKA